MEHRQPLLKPHAPNEMWSADFVFDRTAEGRVVKCLASWTMPRRRPSPSCPLAPLGGLAVTRVLERLASLERLPQVLRTNNALEFCGWP